MKTIDQDSAHTHTHTQILRTAVQWQRHSFDSKFLPTSTEDTARVQQWLSAATMGQAPFASPLHVFYAFAAETHCDVRSFFGPDPAAADSKTKDKASTTATAAAAAVVLSAADLKAEMAATLLAEAKLTAPPSVLMVQTATDAPFAKQILGALSKPSTTTEWKGHIVPCDFVPTGQETAAELRAVVLKADVVVAVLSPHSAHEKGGRALDSWNGLIDAALALGKRIVPVVEHDFDSRHVRKELTTLNWYITPCACACATIARDGTDVHPLRFCIDELTGSVSTPPPAKLPVIPVPRRRLP
jgi:hypothetical protein